MEHFVMPSIVERHYDELHDAIVITTTTKAYMVLYLARLDDAVEFLLAPAPTNLPEFLQPPPALPKYELMLEFKSMPKLEPLPVYDPLLEFEPMSPDLPPLEPIASKMPVIEISSSDSPTPTPKPLPESDLIELDPFEATSTAARRVSSHSSRRGRASGFIPQSFPVAVVVGDVVIKFMPYEFYGRIDFSGFVVVVVPIICGCL